VQRQDHGEPVCAGRFPAQPVKASKPPSGADWVHEIKHDGYRLIVRRDGPTVRLYTRNAFDWTARLPAIASTAQRIKAKSFTIDGEAVSVVRTSLGGRTNEVFHTQTPHLAAAPSASRAGHLHMSTDQLAGCSTNIVQLRQSIIRQLGPGGSE
jgi:ATP dependent DNA ligase domain